MESSLDSFRGLSRFKSFPRGSSSSKSVGRHDIAIRECTNKYAGMTVVELGLSCSNLPKLDLFGLSDPFVVMYLRNKDEVQKLGKTETVWYSLNPNFVRVFDLPLDTPRSTLIKCDVYDRDHHLDDLNRHDYIGRVQVSFDEILKAKDGQLQKDLINDDTHRPWRVKVGTCHPPLLSLHATVSTRLPGRSGNEIAPGRPYTQVWL